MKSMGPASPLETSPYRAENTEASGYQKSGEGHADQNWDLSYMTFPLR